MQVPYNRTLNITAQQRTFSRRNQTGNADAGLCQTQKRICLPAGAAHTSALPGVRLVIYLEDQKHAMVSCARPQQYSVALALSQRQNCLGGLDRRRQQGLRCLCRRRRIQFQKSLQGFPCPRRSRHLRQHVLRTA